MLIINMCLSRKYSDYDIMVTSDDEFGSYSWRDEKVDKTLSIPIKSYGGFKADINDYLDEYTAINNANILGTKRYDLENSSNESSKNEPSKKENSKIETS